MYSLIKNEESGIQFLKTAEEFFESYNRDPAITRREQKIAELKAGCEEMERRTELLKQFSNHFFEERKKIKSIAMSALDKAIDLGNPDVAEIALAIIGKEYSRDFFGMMNKISGVR